MFAKLYARAEENAAGGKSYDVKVLMGRRDDPLLVLYARQLIEQIRFGVTTMLASVQIGLS